MPNITSALKMPGRVQTLMVSNGSPAYSAETAQRLACLFQAAARVGPRLTAIRSLRRLLSEGADLIRQVFSLEAVSISLAENGHAMPAPDASPETLSLPLNTDHPLGTLTLRAQAPFEPGDASVYQLVADQLAAAIQNAQLYLRDAQVLASAEHRAMLLEAATQVGRDVTSIMDLDTLLARIVDTLCLVYGFYYSAIFLVDTKLRQWAVLRAAYGDIGRQLLESGYLLEINGDSAVGWCIRQRQAHITHDAAPAEAQTTANARHSLLAQTRLEMALPLIVGEQVIGALNVHSTQETAFEEKDTNTLQVMADQLAIVINNAFLLQDLRDKNRELVRTKTFEAIATATGEAIHWVGNKAAPIPACIKRTREDMARLIYMAEAVLQQSPQELHQHLYAQMIADAAATLDEQLPDGRNLIAGLEGQPFKKLRRTLSMESILEDLDIVRQSAQTILNIKEDLIGPVRQPQRQRVCVDELLKKLVASMALTQRGLQVQQHYAENLPPVLADPRQLDNVFGNLVKNAVEAMEGQAGPRLTLQAIPAQVEGYLAVRIADNGCGIPKDSLDRIWVTFYTTKGERGGTGLGLSACAQIINQLEGKIEVESEVGVGTIFTVTLPALRD